MTPRDGRLILGLAVLTLTLLALHGTNPSSDEFLSYVLQSPYTGDTDNKWSSSLCELLSNRSFDSVCTRKDYGFFSTYRVVDGHNKTDILGIGNMFFRLGDERIGR